jgi:hypothetical protein
MKPKLHQNVIGFERRIRPQIRPPETFAALPAYERCSRSANCVAHAGIAGSKVQCIRDVETRSFKHRELPA